MRGKLGLFMAGFVVGMIMGHALRPAHGYYIQQQQQRMVPQYRPRPRAPVYSPVPRQVMPVPRNNNFTPRFNNGMHPAVINPNHYVSPGGHPYTPVHPVDIPHNTTIAGHPDHHVGAIHTSGGANGHDLHWHQHGYYDDDGDWVDDDDSPPYDDGVDIDVGDPDDNDITFTNNTGTTVDVQFYSKARLGWGWPASNRHWIVDSDSANYHITCESGEQICYGAWYDGNQDGPYWGVGPNAQYGCQACCFTCGAGPASYGIQ